MPDRYELWNKALIDDYFPEGGRGTLAYLPVDDDELRAMGPAHGLCDADQAVDSFVASVIVELAHKNGSFGGFSTWVDGWRRVRDTPPYVGGLALCVLAASRMETDPSVGIAANNYYSQLNLLIGRDARAGAPRGFDLLPKAWNDLTRWLDDDCRGTRGNSTIRTHTKWKYVGYPLSQALLRACDRRRLPDFFKVAGLEPGTDISADRLFVLLAAWSAQPSCGLTTAGRNAVQGAKDVDRDEIAETVLRELRAWDGELRDARGRRRVQLNLLIYQRARGTNVRLIAPRKEGFPETNWIDEKTSQPLALQEHIASDEWFAPLDVNVNSKVLESGLQFTSGNYAFAYEPSVAIPCRQAPVEIGGYISEPHATLWEPHLAVVSAGHSHRLLPYLSRYCDSAVEVHPSKSNLPSNWQVTKPFRMSAIPVDPPREFARLAPRLIATTSFDGGLQVRGGLYLTQGEPDVFVAAEPGLGLEVELDGERQDFSGGALSLELSKMDLPPGAHQIKAEVTRTFSTAETMGDLAPPSAGTLGHPFSRHKDFLPQSVEPVDIAREVRPGTASVAGAEIVGHSQDLPLGDRRPHLFRAGARRYIVIGAWPHHVVVQASQTPPDWLRHVGLEGLVQFVEIDASFVPAWVLTESSIGALRVRAMNPSAPVRNSESVRHEWVKAVLEWREADVMGHAQHWDDYVSAAIELSKESLDADR
jgi:hypothetical protein